MLYVGYENIAERRRLKNAAKWNFAENVVFEINCNKDYLILLFIKAHFKKKYHQYLII